MMIRLGIISGRFADTGTMTMNIYIYVTVNLLNTLFNKLTR